MKFARKMTALFLVLAMLFCLGACSKGADDGNGEPAGQQAAQEAGDAAGAQEDAAQGASAEEMDAAEAGTSDDPAAEGTPQEEIGDAGDGASVDETAHTLEEETPAQAGDAGDASDPASETDPASQEDSKDGKALVVYFSRTGEQYSVGTIDKGNTAIAAGMIASIIGADSFEVLPQEDYYPYTYKELTDVAKQEQNDKARPAYKGSAPDLSQYSTIFIGAPVWWGDWPMIMYTFFESENLAGKTLVPFSTHEGSGLSGFDKKLASACPNAEILEGLAIRGSDAQNNQEKVRSAVSDWLSGLGF